MLLCHRVSGYVGNNKQRTIMRRQLKYVRLASPLLATLISLTNALFRFRYVDVHILIHNNDKGKKKRRNNSIDRTVSWLKCPRAHIHAHTHRKTDIVDDTERHSTNCCVEHCECGGKRMMRRKFKPKAIKKDKEKSATVARMDNDSSHISITNHDFRKTNYKSILLLMIIIMMTMEFALCRKTINFFLLEIPLQMIHSTSYKSHNRKWCCICCVNNRTMTWTELHTMTTHPTGISLEFMSSIVF